MVALLQSSCLIKGCAFSSGSNLLEGDFDRIFGVLDGLFEGK